MRPGGGVHAQINPDKDARETRLAFPVGKLVLVMTTYLPAARDVPRILPVQEHIPGTRVLPFLPWNFAISKTFETARLRAKCRPFRFRKLKTRWRSFKWLIASVIYPRVSRLYFFKDKNSTNISLRGRARFRNARKQKYLLCASYTHRHTHTHTRMCKHPIKRITRCAQTIPFQWTTQYIKPDCISRGKWPRGDVGPRCRLSSLFFLLASNVLY